MVRAIAVKKYSAPDFKSLPGATYCNRSNLGVTTTNNIENTITSQLIGNSRSVGLVANSKPGKTHIKLRILMFQN